MLAILGRVTREMIQELAGVLANALGWDMEQKEAEVARTLSIGGWYNNSLCRQKNPE